VLHVHSTFTRAYLWLLTLSPAHTIRAPRERGDPGADGDHFRATLHGRDTAVRARTARSIPHRGRPGPRIGIPGGRGGWIRRHQRSSYWLSWARYLGLLRLDHARSSQARYTRSQRGSRHLASSRTSMPC